MIRILHVDDNETDRLLVKRELGRVLSDLHTEEVADQQKLDAALADGPFALVITDFKLNWSDGLQVLGAVKARHPDLPVIMFTGTGNEEVAVEAMKAGLDDYVVKSPRHGIRLVTAVRSALDRAEARRRMVEAERERADLLRREQEARAEAERLLHEAQEADRRKDEFLAMLAHELRNPLAPISNAVHLLRQPALTAEAESRVQHMLERQVKHLSRLVDDLLDVTRLTRGKIELRRERVDLARLVRDVIDDHQEVIHGSRLQVYVDAPSAPLWVWGDRTRLTQIIGNLVQNAVKFSDLGGRVSVRLEADGAACQAVLVVEDTGMGIEPELLPHVFEMFTQADRTLDRSRGGLGLGLALVKGLTELHGGRVSAASEGPGQGSCFTCRLPLVGGKTTSARETTQPAQAGALRVLVIEDSRDAAETMRMLLTLYGHEARVAHNGPAGVEAAREFRPAVVLCDLELPGGMSGHEVAQALRQDPATASARLIAVSGYGQPEDQSRARAAGFDLHLTKPVDPDELRRRLASF